MRTASTNRRSMRGPGRRTGEPPSTPHAAKTKTNKDYMDSTTLTPTSQTQEPLSNTKRSRVKRPGASAEVRPPEHGTTQMKEAELLEQYGCGPIQFSGSGNASYERHLVFDNVMPLEAAGS